MKLGTKVRFNQVARKSTDYVDFNELTTQQANDLDENGFIELTRLEIVELKSPKIGLIMGIRKMKQKTTLEYRSADSDYGSTEGLAPINTVSIDVYLIATDMSKTYKVPCEVVEVMS